MPLISTGTMGSNKSFGFSRGKPKVLTTYTFPGGTSTWTAPAGVTSLTSAVGKGANGQAAYWLNYDVLVMIGVYQQCLGTSIGSTLPWSTLNSEMNSQISAVNNITTSSSGGTYGPFTSRVYNWCSGTSTWGTYTSTFGSRLYRRTGTFTNPYSGNAGNVPTSTNNNLYGTGGTVETFISATTGSSTTGFSLTFPGGTGGIATNTTFNNVTVSPGTTYTITNNGSLTITYYV